MSLWGWVGVAAAEEVVANSGGSLEGVLEVSMDSAVCQEFLGSMGQGVETHGRKLHAEDGRLATRVKISEMRRCCTLVSWLLCQRWFRKKSRGIEPWLVRCRAYQLGVELCKARLAGVVEDKYGIDHDAGEAGVQPFSRVVMSRCSFEYRSMSNDRFQVSCDANAEV